MSLIMHEQVDRPRRRWPRWLALLLTAVAVAIGFWAGWTTNAPRSDDPASTPRAGQWSALWWENVAGTPVPLSTESGPYERVGGVARGFSHDEQGAVLAAVNLAVRGSSAAGAGTYEATLRGQAYGDVEGALRQLSTQSSSADPAETAPQAWWWRISSGDPDTDLVEVTLLMRTAQASQLGGHAQISRTLAWRGGDWRMQVPVSPPTLAVSTSGFTPLGGTGA